MLAYIDQRLQQMMGCHNLPFGGLSVLIMGDFFQMPPVNGEPICKDVLGHTMRQKQVPGAKVQPTPDPDKTQLRGIAPITTVPAHRATPTNASSGRYTAHANA